MSDEFEFEPVTDVSSLSNKKLPELMKKEERAIAKVERENNDALPEEDKDFADARENIKDIIEKGDDVLDKMIELAKASDHPRAYEVVGSLMRTMIDANKDVIEIHERRKKHRSVQIKGEGQGGATTNNTAVFVGSTKDLQKMLRDQQNVINSDESNDQ